jgi:excisionase family DNA binding protein
VTVNLKGDENQAVKTGTRICNPIPKRLFTLKEAAHYLGRGLYGVRDMVWKGKLPVVRDGRKMFVDLKDLDAWIERNKETYVY